MKKFRVFSTVFWRNLRRGGEKGWKILRSEKVNLLLLAAILLVSNYLASLIPLRWDLTSNQRFTLAEGSKKIVRQADDLINIKVFLSPNLPAQYRPLVETVKDLLEEYARLRGSKVRLQYLDPSQNPRLQLELRSQGILPLQFSDISQDKFALSQGYFALLIQYGDKVEPINFILDDRNLEYQISLAIAKLTQKEKPALALVSGHGEPELKGDWQFWGQDLRERFTVRRDSLKNLFQNQEELKNLRALIILAPEKEFSAAEKVLLDQYLMHNGSLLFIADSVRVEGLEGSLIDHKLNQFLDNYGLKLEENLLLDLSNELTTFRSQGGSFTIRYPFWIRIQPQGLAQDFPITAGLETAVFPWSSTITLSDDKLAGVKAVKLIQSSPFSWTITAPFDLNPTQQYNAPAQPQPHLLAVLLEGKLKSAFSEQEQGSDFPFADWQGEAEKARLAVIANSRFLKNRFLQNISGNYDFIANLIDYLVADTRLTTIRSKGETFRPLPQLNPQLKIAIKYLNLWGPSLLLILYGAIHLYRRGVR